MRRGRRSDPRSQDPTPGTPWRSSPHLFFALLWLAVLLGASALYLAEI
ncbi:hypothetical protein [Pseudonocardia sp. TRM90224]|nr:hypothetical protein [Pseudonocardia sp. TRM90224]